MDRLRPCKLEEGPIDAHCGTMEVFENRQVHEGRRISLKIVVLPALRRDPRPDPLFVFSGGPGTGAAKLAKMYALMFRRMQEDRDIVLIDQRGTGDSGPLHCKPPEKEEDFSAADQFPEERYRACLAEYQADPRFYVTSIAMDDIDEVRQHLGYGQINLWGGSYGTRAALVYLKQHPDAVRSVVLDGVAPMDMRLPLFAARDGQRALDLLIRDCEANAACKNRYPNLRQNVGVALSIASTSPNVTMTHPRTGERLEFRLSRMLVSAAIFNTLYDPAKSALLPRVLEDAAKGDFQGLIALITPLEGISDVMAVGMQLSVLCPEDLARFSPEDLVNETKNTFAGPDLAMGRYKICRIWPRGEVKEGFYEPAKSDKPVLILSGDADPVTPPSWGESVARNLSNSRHIVVPGMGHGTTNAGCVPRLMNQFLNELKPAALDASCVQKLHRPPFFVTHSGPLEGGK